MQVTRASYIELVMTLKFVVLLSGVIVQSYKSFSFNKVHKRENCLILGFGILNDEETFIFSKHLYPKIKYANIIYVSKVYILI